jgi:hypothetical protein
MRGARALILVVAWFATAMALAIACVDVIVFANYTHGGEIDGAAHTMFDWLESGEIERHPNIEELYVWARDEAARVRAAGGQPRHRPMKPRAIRSFPVLDANGAAVEGAPEFGFVRYGGTPEDPTVTCYTFGSDILAVRAQWEYARPSIEERWRIFDEPRLVECLRAIEAGRPE